MYTIAAAICYIDCNFFLQNKTVKNETSIIGEVLLHGEEHFRSASVCTEGMYTGPESWNTIAKEVP